MDEFSLDHLDDIARTLPQERREDIGLFFGCFFKEREATRVKERLMSGDSTFEDWKIYNAATQIRKNTTLTKIIGILSAYNRVDSIPKVLPHLTDIELMIIQEQYFAYDIASGYKTREYTLPMLLALRSLCQLNCFTFSARFDRLLSLAHAKPIDKDNHNRNTLSSYKIDSLSFLKQFLTLTRNGLEIVHPLPSEIVQKIEQSQTHVLADSRFDEALGLGRETINLIHLKYQEILEAYEQ